MLQHKAAARAGSVQTAMIRESRIAEFTLVSSFNIAGMCWFLQLMMSIRTDNGPWALDDQGTSITGMVFSALLGAIRFVKWAWGANISLPSTIRQE
jgi:hypothetical protein